MFVEDLSPMPGAVPEGNKKMTAIGWLDCLHRFTKGKSPESFRDKIHRLCANPVRLTRGFHLCPFCGTEEVRGNGEIHVTGADGVVYVAPSLIWHYISKHDYRPPNQFMEAVMATDLDQLSVGELSQAIMRFADEPTVHNQTIFYDIFAKSRVGIRVPDAFGTVPSGDYVTTSSNKVSVPMAILPDGTSTLLVLADVDKLAKLEASSTFMQLNAKDIIDMALKNNIGIIVQASLPGREAWAGISANDVTSLRNV